jgi:hypothetical protein
LGTFYLYEDMRRFFVFAVAAVVASPVSARAQDRADRRSAGQVADSVEIAQLARTLTRDVSGDSARAARLYEWVARNLAYDVKGFLSGRLSDGTPEKVYRRRVAVCGGYVALFQRLAREAGLHAEPIYGYAKGFTYRSGASSKRPNHAWLALRVNDRWRLVDPTWGSGFVNNGRFEPRFTWDYFMVDASELILSHFPEDARWQLLPKQVRRAEFERLPMVPRTLIDVGFDPTVILVTALSGRLRNFPLVGPRQGVRIIAAPLAGTLPRAASVSFDLVWPGATDVALVSGGVWRRLARDGDRFRGEVVAAESVVSLVGRTDGKKPFETLLQYEVQ